MGEKITKFPKIELHAKDIAFADEKLYVSLANGRLIAIPLVWYPRLTHAARTNQLANF
jgi:hypothetical protein